MSKTIGFWNPSLQKVAVIPAAWDETFRLKQREILMKQGYLPVDNYRVPRSQMPFAFVSDHFEIVDGTVVQTICETPRKVRLSQDKLLRHPAVRSRIEHLMASLSSDEELIDWWANDMCYLRGSPVAKKAMAAFDLSQDEMEKIVRECLK